MCGFFISNDPIVSDKLSVIESCLRFRGPDASSALVEYQGWYAYHSRLSIIDVETGANQPVVVDGVGLLVFNGEILNFKELGKKYFAKDYHSDTLLLFDLIVGGLLHLPELDGFFAFAFIDAGGELCHAVRDSFGVKPLFVYESDSGAMTLSSEPNVLRSIFGLKASEKSVEEYYSLRYPVFSGSYFEGVKSVHPGACYISGSYFSPASALSDSIARSEVGVSSDKVEDALKTAISSRMVSDVPVGLLLSKGVDSHLIKALSPIVHYFSIGFEGDADYEFLKASAIPGLELYTASEDEYLRDLDYLLKLRQEPLSVPNEVLLFRIAKVASDRGIKVLLSGEGADEFFGGYDRIFRWGANTEPFDLDSFIALYCYKQPKKGSHVYKSFEEVFDGLEPFSKFDKVRLFFVLYHLPVLFRRLDFSLMAAGVEGREPIANRHIFDVAIRCGKEVLMNLDLGKLPLREVAARYYGEDFAYENKVGFPVDLTRILPNPQGLSSYELWFQRNIEVLK